MIESNKKVIGISIPCYNEEENIQALYLALKAEFETNLPEYNFLVQFIDNCSTDRTQLVIRELCQQYTNVRAIFNAKNYKSNSALYGMLQAEGDCVIYLSADFQDPIEKIPEMIHEWEKGHLIVAAIKNSTNENSLKKAARKIFYKLMKRYSTVGFIEQFCNFGVYDRKFLDIVNALDRPYYSIRGNVAEFGYDIAYVSYDQPPRRHGKSNYNIWKLYNLAIDNFVNYTNIILRVSTLLGIFSSIVFFILGVIYFILKLTHWSEFQNGLAPVLIGIFFIGSIQTFLLGIIGEYVLSVKTKVSSAPLVIERERINFDLSTSDNTENGGICDYQDSIA